MWMKMAKRQLLWGAPAAPGSRQQPTEDNSFRQAAENDRLAACAPQNKNALEFQCPTHKRTAAQSKTPM
jgi:hypothetical protein